MAVLVIGIQSRVNALRKNALIMSGPSTIIIAIIGCLPAQLVLEITHKYAP